MGAVDVDSGGAPRLEVAPCGRALAVAATLVHEGEPASLARNPVGSGQGDAGQGARGKEEEEEEARHCDSLDRVGKSVDNRLWLLQILPHTCSHFDMTGEGW